MIRAKTKRDRFGEIQRKLLLLLFGGIALSCTYSLKKRFEILEEIIDEWKGIKRYNINKSLKQLYLRGYVSERVKADGTVEVVLSDKGKSVAEFFTIDDLEIKKPKQWDGNWRIVIFDIPEKFKNVRESLRMHLRNFGFYELQKSVFILPYPCLEQIDQVVKFYNIKNYVRLITANSLDNEQDLMEVFDLE